MNTTISFVYVNMPYILEMSYWKFDYLYKH